MNKINNHAIHIRVKCVLAIFIFATFWGYMTLHIVDIN